MDLGNAVIRTMRAQESLEAKFDQLLERFGGTPQISTELITLESPKPDEALVQRLDDIGTKLDLLLEAVSALQPASKKKAKADPANSGDAAGDAAGGGE